MIESIVASLVVAAILGLTGWAWKRSAKWRADRRHRAEIDDIRRHGISNPIADAQRSLRDLEELARKHGVRPPE